MISNVLIDYIMNAGVTSCPLPLPTLSSSLIFLKATESLYPATTIQSRAPPLTNSLNSGVIIGIAAGGILVVIITLTVVIVVHLLKKRLLTEEFHPVSNQACGIGLQDAAKQVENDTFYDYPIVDHEASIATEQNEAYATNIEMQPSVAYAVNITTEKNKAYEAVSPSVYS